MYFTVIYKNALINATILTIVYLFKSEIEAISLDW
jgi:hypothetical protein